MKHSTTCSHCGGAIIDIDTEITNFHAHSMAIIVQHITPQGYEFYQAESDQRVHRHNFNFWHCSKDHMLREMPNHISKHVVEGKFQAPAPGNIVNLQSVLEENLTCAICSLPLTEAYRIQVWYATPIATTPHTRTNAEDEGWCCTLAHARQEIIQMISDWRGA